MPTRLAFHSLPAAIAPPPRLLVLLAALVLPVRAGAEDAPAAPAPEVVQPPDMDATDARIAAVLHSQLVHAKVWYWSWASFYGAISITETVINATSSGSAQSSAQVNIATSAFGFFATVIFPPPVAFDWEPIELMPQATPEQRVAKTKALRELFAREVSRERFRHSVWGHLLGFGFNAAVCSYMYFALHLGGRALLNFLLGSAFWEANILTSPNASMELADNLRDKTSSAQLQVVPLALGPTGVGLALTGRF